MNKNEKPKHIYPNLVSNQNITAKTNVVWACDITNLELEENKKLQIFILIDIHANVILGFLVRKNKIRCEAIVKVLRRVIQERFSIEPKNKVILHSDRGTQFTSNHYNLVTIIYHLAYPYSKVYRIPGTISIK